MTPNLPTHRSLCARWLAVATVVAVTFAPLPAAAADPEASPRRVRGWLSSPAGLPANLPPEARWLDREGGFVELPEPAVSILAARGLLFRESPEAFILSAGGERFDVRLGEPPLAPEWKADAAKPAAGGVRPFLVKFDQPVRPEWLAAIAGSGGTVVQYLPAFGYLVLAPPGVESALARLQHVEFSGEYHPAYKADADLRGMATGDGSLTLRLVYFDLPGWDSALDAVVATGARLVHGSDAEATSQRHLLHYAIFEAVPQRALPTLLRDPRLYRAERWLPPQVEGERAAQIVAGNVAAGHPLPGYHAWLADVGADGTGVTIAVADTGLDTGNLATLHPDIRGRVAFATALCGSNSDPDGHGTNTTSIAAGDPRVVNGGTGLQDPGGFYYGGGSAPGASVYFQKALGGGGCVAYNANAATLADDAVRLGGAQLGTHSFTDGLAGGASYTSQSAAWDAAVRDAVPSAFGAQGYAVHFSAGNSGPSASTLTSPKAAKNILTVGASENDRPGECPGIAGCGNSADDIDALVSFSSRGPTTDGRIKPDVVAPGHVVSGMLSSIAPYDCACDPGGGAGCCDSADPDFSGLYTRYSGTSQASPRVAGASALVYEWFRNRVGVFPSPAMDKAILINGATDPGGADAPNNSEGWGRLSLRDVFQSPEGVQLHDQGTVIGTTGDPSAFTANLYVQDPSRPLKATLVWTDPPGSVNCNPCLVNDLDLLISQGGTTWRGNNFVGGFSTTAVTADSRNNVEGVTLAPNSLTCGATFQVKVRAQTLAGDGVPGNGDPTDQDFALVTRNAAPTPGPPSVAVVTPAVGGGCDADTFLDRTETAAVTVDVQNVGCSNATAAVASLVVASNPAGAGVSIVPAGTQALGTLSPGATAQGVWQVSLADAVGSYCGATITFQVVVTDALARSWSGDVEVLLDGEGYATTPHLDPATADQSFAKDAEWSLRSCQTTSAPTSWHMGQADCTGIVRDASERNLVFAYALAPGDLLGSLGFKHAFAGYSNTTLHDTVTVEFDHDNDGAYTLLQTWSDGIDNPTVMTTAGPYDLSGLNAGRADTVKVRFRFQGGANWVGGPNSAPGWNVDDISLVTDVLTCDPHTCVSCPPAPAPVPDGTGGSTPLTVDYSGGGELTLSWGSVAGATGYNLYEGTIGSWGSSVSFADAGLAGGDSCHEPALAATFAMPAGNVYFLIAAENECVEGNYGTTSTGALRPYAVAPCTPH